MNIEELVVFLVIGAVAGWLAGILMKGGGFGLVGNIIVGAIGAVLGSYMFGFLGISLGTKIVGQIITATAGAALLLFIVKLIRKV